MGKDVSHEVNSSCKNSENEIVTYSDIVHKDNTIVRMCKCRPAERFSYVDERYCYWFYAVMPIFVLTDVTT